MSCDIGTSLPWAPGQPVMPLSREKVGAANLTVLPHWWPSRCVLTKSSGLYKAERYNLCSTKTPAVHNPLENVDKPGLFAASLEVEKWWRRVLSSTPKTTMPGSWAVSTITMLCKSVGKAWQDNLTLEVKIHHSQQNAKPYEYEALILLDTHGQIIGNNQVVCSSTRSPALQVSGFTEESYTLGKIRRIVSGCEHLAIGGVQHLSLVTV